MWDKRYDTEAYAYGTLPNDFLKENVWQLPKGKILSLAEGEGRNAVYLASLGYDVTAVDASLVGLQKAESLAKQRGVTITCIHADLAHFDFGQEQWDAVISIFCPLPSDIRKKVYQHLPLSLKKNGVFLLEAYSPEQVHNDTGGGKSVDVMQTVCSLKEELPLLNFIHLRELNREIIEGVYHTGVGAVVQAIAVK